MANLPTKPSRSASPEYNLHEYALRLAKHHEGRLALHIHLSRLQTQHRRDHYIRIAIDTFENQVKLFEGQLFVLSNTDIIFVAKGVRMADLDEPVNRLRLLFQEDPLTLYREDDFTTGFCTWYQLDFEYEDFLRSVKQIFAASEQRRRAEERESDMQEKIRKGTPLSSQTLVKIDEILGQADITNMLRRQTVCTLMDDAPAKPVFQEIYVSIEELRSVVCPTIDLMGNRWLFQYLTHTLDKRVLLYLTRDSARMNQPFSLNLNLASLLSPEFQRFDQVVAPQLRGRLVIELQAIDIFADMGAFVFARDYLRERGYRLCLDGMTHLTLPYLERAKLGFDLIKLFWTPEALDTVPSAMLKDLRNQIAETGQSRVILCRCENEEAMELGRELGIVMYQGRHIEKLLYNSKGNGPVNPFKA
jgi:EAL domain-containing protein (putative c-di-GMP-specific phosphodiesterase class I)